MRAPLPALLRRAAKRRRATNWVCASSFNSNFFNPVYLIVSLGIATGSSQPASALLAPGLAPFLSSASSQKISCPRPSSPSDESSHKKGEYFPFYCFSFLHVHYVELWPALLCIPYTIPVTALSFFFFFSLSCTN